MNNHYIIGDLQGSYGAFNRLLQLIEFDENTDRITLCGDIVARGEDSLSTLRYVKKLADKGVLTTVLGNHDITLIANWLGLLKVKKKDNTQAILAAHDCDELIEWLRRQPLLLDIVLPCGNSARVVHAGIPHIWSDLAARHFAGVAGEFLADKKVVLKRHLLALYDKHATDNTLDEIRLIVNYFTRMRLINAQGLLEFGFKGNPNNTPADLPDGFDAWYQFDSQQTKRIYFGHWASLQASVDNKQVRALDGGAVWGGRLLAYRLHDDRVFCVSNPLL